MIQRARSQPLKSIFALTSSTVKGNLLQFIRNVRWPGSVVGIATAYGLEGIESRWGEIFRTSPDRP